MRLARTLIGVLLLCASPALADTVDFTYTPAVHGLPTDNGWHIGNYVAYESGHATIDGGALHLVDDGTSPGTAIHYDLQFAQTTAARYVVEADLRLGAVTQTGSAFIGVNAGADYVHLGFYSDHIEVRSGGVFVASIEVDTSVVRTYALEIGGGAYTVSIDGSAVYSADALSGPLRFRTPTAEFGLGSSPLQGDMYLSEIRGLTGQAVPEPAALALALPALLLARPRRTRS